MEQSKGKTKLAIFSVGILMMGAMAIASGLAVIGEHFGDVPQTSIQLLITIPCMIIIVANPVFGKLQRICSYKDADFDRCNVFPFRRDCSLSILISFNTCM